jgi:hypothetical protein
LIVGKQSKPRFFFELVECNGMTRSIHDNLIVSYEVQCETRRIVLHTEYHAFDKTTEYTDIVFTGVEGYHFENDAFSNIILNLEEVRVAQILSEYYGQISESYRKAGAPGPWAANLDGASEFLSKKGIKGYLLSSSIGLSGWVLAREVSIVPTSKSPRSPADK